MTVYELVYKDNQVDPLLYATEDIALKRAWQDYLDSTVFEEESPPPIFDEFVRKLWRDETNYEVRERVVFLG